MSATGTPEAGTMYPTDVRWAVLEELREEARAVLPADVADFLDSGAGTERTLRANRAAFERWTVAPRPMSGLGRVDTSTSFLGVDLGLPVLTAPFGGDGLFGPGGHLAIARANASHGAASIVPEAGTHSYEQVAAVAPAAARFAQVHPWDGFGDVVARIAAAGYDAVCVTVDCPTGGFRARNRRNRFAPDLAWFAGNLQHDGAPSVGEMFSRLVAQNGGTTWDWERLAVETAAAGLPWIAKGVLDARAARRALDAGAAAVLVSNHGGRQVDPAPASLDVLPEIVDAVGGRAAVAVDSGIRTGADVFTALALGADVVVVGRLAAYGLAAGGEAGVSRTLELLAEELRTLMILAGAPDLRSLDRSFLRAAP